MFLSIYKNGLFFNVFGDDASILHYLLNYRVISNKVGFPTNALNKVVNTLEEKKINYKILKDEQAEIKNFKNQNKYSYYLSKAKDKHEVDTLLRKIQDKLNEFSEEKTLEMLYKFLEIVSEQ